METLNFDKFSDLFDKELFYQLEPYEKKRLKIMATVKWVAIILSIIALIVYAVFLISSKGEAWLGGLSVVLIPIVPTVILASLLISKFRKQVKQEVYKKLFNSVGFTYSNSFDDKTKSESNINTVCQKSDILSCYDHISVDDVVYGEYRSLPFRIADAVVYHYETDSDGKKHKVNDFSGIFLETSIKKTLNADILIKSKNYMQFGSDQKPVKFEDVEFNKNFNVYSDDQIESRYIMTTSFIDKLLKYKKARKGSSVEAVFSNNILPNENVFFFIDNGKNNFEIPMTKKITDKETVFGILKELADVLDIIKELKLDQNIGL